MCKFEDFCVSRKLCCITWFYHAMEFLFICKYWHDSFSCHKDHVRWGIAVEIINSDFSGPAGASQPVLRNYKEVVRSMDGWYGGGCKQALLYFKLAFVNEVLDFIYWACSSTHKTHWNARFHDTLLNAQFKSLDSKYLWTWSSASINTDLLVYYGWQLTLSKKKN